METAESVRESAPHSLDHWVSDKKVAGTLLRLTGLVHILWGINLAYLLAHFSP